MKTKALLMSVAAFLSFGNIAFAGDSELCRSEFAQYAFESAFRYCEKACSKYDGAGCTRLGWLYDQGRGVRQDFQEAQTYYEKACNLSDADGCRYLGILYEVGWGGVRQNKKFAKEYYGRACDLGSELGCYKACDLGSQKGCDEFRKLNEPVY